MHEAWTEADEAVVIFHFPDYPALLIALPRRTRTAIRTRAGKLGLTKRKRDFTTGDLRRIKELAAGGLVTDEVRAAFPDRHPMTIRHAAKANGYPVPSRKLVVHTDPSIENIRREASRQGYTLQDLDRTLGTGTIFCRSNPVVSLRVKMKAAALLGGRLVIKWQPL